MKVLPFKIPKPDDDALVYQVDFGTSFYDKLHQHKEIQISYIVEGYGTLVVGDSINDYTKNDVIIIGGNVPHVFKSEQNDSSNFHMISLFFTRESFGSLFFDLEELKEVLVFFKRAKHGFKISTKLKQIEVLFLELEKSTKLNRFLILLQILKITSKANYKSLSSFIYDKTYSDNEGQRMRNVFDYTMNNFKSDISLTTISNVANMTKNAFCKYFKKRTNKTYIQFLNELRIEYACKLLESDNDLSIVEIAEQAGFNNMSNFNRQFKSIKQCNPSEFRKLSF
ncbi:AraC family transcriptional regulator [Algibacter marinivivus]|uniref:AraC family transcriptional regulator n=1 Tax=Algibacter marinivivus TaxID=2100723 RepID=A0A2U2X710_9FLAO|nr:AraC family transcriptional regulator [Algibacter marinivivus]PWH83543.1 AraC family transcriptional regulator [Algibacter marinivivus]